MSIIIVVGIVFCLLILIGGFFITQRIASTYLERDHPSHVSERRALRNGRIATGVAMGAVIISVVIVVVNSSPSCELPPVVSSNSPTCVTDTVNIDGSTALQPLVKMVTDDYTEHCPGSTFNVQESTSGQGLGYVEGGTHGVVIGDSDILAPPQDSDLVDHVVAVAIFCVIVNNDAGVTNLSTSDLQGIYSGRITDWQQVGGRSESIQVISRPAGSGTQGIFQQYVLNGTPEAVVNPNPAPTTPDLVQKVMDTPGAIGYADFYDVPSNTSNARIVNIDGVPASTTTVSDNTYHFWSFEHMYTKGNASGLALDLIKYMNSPRGKAIAQAHSYVDVADIKNFAGSGHCP